MIVYLKDIYSDYYIRLWKKQGLRLVTERPPTTTQEILDEFFKYRNSRQRKVSAKSNQKRKNKSKNQENGLQRISKGGIQMKKYKINVPRLITISAITLLLLANILATIQLKQLGGW